jgi:ribonuclease P protein component
MNTFTKEERLHGRTTVAEVFTKGKRFQLDPYRIVWRTRAQDDLPSIRFGISVSKKISKKAVERNRIKRCNREAYRAVKQSFIEELHAQNKQIDLFLVYSGSIETSTEVLKEKIILILNRLIATHGKPIN